MGTPERSEDLETGIASREFSEQPHNEAKELAKDSNLISPPTPSSPTSSTHDPNKRPPCFTNGLQEVLFVLTCTMAIGISSFTIGTITVITARIGADLHMSNAEITWINASCSLAAGSFLMFFARVADLFGRRSMFIVSLGLFSLFVMAAGFSRSPIEMDVLMGITGLMSAGAVPPAQGLLGVIYDKPSKRKNAVFACFSAGNPLGFVFGMISSGVATQILSWRASFWWIAIVYACFTVVAIFTVPSDPTEKQKLSWETLRRFDIPGVLLVVAGIGMFSGALSLGGDAPQGWRTSYVIAVLVLGVACLVVFVVWECYCETPLVPMRIFKDRNFSLLLSMLLFGFMGFTSAGFWVPLYFQRVWHSSALKTAVYLLPMAIMGILVNVIAGMVLHRVSNKLLMGIGASAYTTAFLLYSVAKTRFSYWSLFFPGLALTVVGADFEFNVTNMYVMSTMSRSQQSVAGGLFQTISRLCITIGFGISTAVFSAVQKNPSKTGYHANDPIEPYSATYWFSFATAAVSLLLLPWITIGTQGHGEKSAGSVEQNPHQVENLESPIEGKEGIDVHAEKDLKALEANN